VNRGGSDCNELEPQAVAKCESVGKDELNASEG
jgi:hypothetical protein